MPWRKIVSVLLIISSIFLVSAAKGCQTAGGISQQVDGGVYGIINPRGYVVYVGMASNLSKRMREWELKYGPGYSGRVLITTDEIGLQKGIEQYLYERFQAVARSNGFALNNREQPMDTSATGTKGVQWRTYYRLGKDFVTKTGLTRYDTRNFGPYAEITDFGPDNFGPYNTSTISSSIDTGQEEG